MQRLLFIALLSCPFVSLAKVEMKSIYFDKYTDAPTQSSKSKLERLKLIFEKENSQIIEINAYSNIEGSFNKNKTLSQERLALMLSLLKIEPSNISINAYGNKRVQINFKPENWNRIDVYYNVAEPILIEDKTPEDSLTQIDLTENPTTPDPEELVNTETQVSTDERKVPELDEIVENMPLVVPINFIGGTDDIISEDQEYLEDLYNTLAKHSSLSAHIRGHVCCMNNKRMSKLRAKRVYQYLVEKGIDENRLSFKGYSNKQPIVFPERTGSDRAINRRVDVIFKKN